MMQHMQSMARASSAQSLLRQSGQECFHLLQPVLQQLRLACWQWLRTSTACTYWVGAVVQTGCCCAAACCCTRRNRCNMASWTLC